MDLLNKAGTRRDLLRGALRGTAYVAPVVLSAMVPRVISAASSPLSGIPIITFPGGGGGGNGGDNGGGGGSGGDTLFTLASNGTLTRVIGDVFISHTTLNGQATSCPPGSGQFLYGVLIQSLNDQTFPLNVPFTVSLSLNGASAVAIGTVTLTSTFDRHTFLVASAGAASGFQLFLTRVGESAPSYQTPAQPFLYPQTCTNLQQRTF